MLGGFAVAARGACEAVTDSWSFLVLLSLKHFSHPYFRFRFAVTHPSEKLDCSAVRACGIDKGHAQTFFVHAPVYLTIKVDSRSHRVVDSALLQSTKYSCTSSRRTRLHKYYPMQADDGVFALLWHQGEMRIVVDTHFAYGGPHPIDLALLIIVDLQRYGELHPFGSIA